MFKQNPVAWLSALVTILTAVDGTLTGLHVLSAPVAGYVGVAIAVLTAVLGVFTHNAVTPVSNPHDNSGRPLVPLSTTGGGTAGRGGESSCGPVIRRSVLLPRPDWGWIKP